MGVGKGWLRGLIGIVVSFTAVPGSAEVLRAGGTGSALAPVARVAERYAERHPGVEVQVLPSMGSGRGIRALADGKLDLALSARPLEAAERDRGLEAVEFARTPFVFVVQRARPVEAVSLAQVVEIFAGRMARWPDGVPIRLILRPETDADTTILRAVSPELGAAVDLALARPGMIVATTDQESADLAERSPGAFTTSTLSQILAEGRALRPLALDGVNPSPQTLAAGTYRAFKSFYLVTRVDAAPAARAFAAFLTSQEGGETLAAFGIWRPR